MSPITKYDIYLGIARAVNKGNFEDASTLATIISKTLRESEHRDCDEDTLPLTRVQVRRIRKLIAE